MSLELYVKFRNESEYLEHKNYIEKTLRASKSFMGDDTYQSLQGSCRGLLFKSESDENSWGYDVRIFFHDAFILIEISFLGQTFYQELKEILTTLKQKMSFDITDEDNEVFEW